MKILWIVNTIFPGPSMAIGKPFPIYGGWMYGLAEQISKQDNVQLAVATTYGGKELMEMTIDGIIYFLLPCKSSIQYNASLESLWVDICKTFDPNLIHIHGTEYAHGLACMNSLPSLKYVVSIQGLVSVYERYFYAGISFFEVIKNITFRDIVKRDSLFQGKNAFRRRGEIEQGYLKQTDDVIGRTSWDYSHTKQINKNVNYHFCNESLRDQFYCAEVWSLDNCEKNTIFLSQASYPIKGLHIIIKALFFLKQDFPGLKLRIGGADITKKDSFKDRIKLSGYGNYICELLQKYHLKDSIIFLGALSESEMIQEYKNANVFICPSSIENSPNSLGEAQLLGTPVIASYVGGIPDMVVNDETGLLYRFEEVEMLAQHIRRLFGDNDLARRLSSNGRQAAQKRHNRNVNLERTIEIYNKILTC